MTPYREKVDISRGTPRSRLKTTWLRTLIRLRGAWRDRMVRCALCRKGVLKQSTVYGRSGEPGGAFWADVRDAFVEFPCGHKVGDHKKHAR